MDEEIDKVVVANHRDSPLTIVDGNGDEIAVLPPRISSFGFEIPEGAYLMVINP